MARDFAALEKRRIRAATLFAQRYAQSEVARQLGVTRQSVSRWYQKWKEDGPESLKAAGRAGRRARLTERQLGQLESSLRCGPPAFGYVTELWTLRRIAKLIYRLFGVRYHPAHVWKVLRNLGWSCQKPTTRAKERDEDAIRRWRKERWPHIKKGLKGKGGEVVSLVAIVARCTCHGSGVGVGGRVIWGPYKQ